MHTLCYKSSEYPLRCQWGLSGYKCQCSWIKVRRHLCRIICLQVGYLYLSSGDQTNFVQQAPLSTKPSPVYFSSFLRHLSQVQSYLFYFQHQNRFPVPVLFLLWEIQGGSDRLWKWVTGSSFSFSIYGIHIQRFPACSSLWLFLITKSIYSAYLRLNKNPSRFLAILRSKGYWVQAFLRIIWELFY